MQKESSWRDFRDIEAMLSTPKLDGVPLGTTLTDTLVIHYFNNHKLPALKPYWYYYARRWINLRLSRLSNSDSLNLATKRKIWVTCKCSERVRNIILPIFEKLPPSDALLLTSCATNSVHDNNRLRLHYLSVIAGVKGSRFAGHTEFTRKMEGVFSAIETQYELSTKLKKLLSISLIHNIAAYARWRAAIRYCRPAIIVTEFDRSSIWSPLILAARREGVPTVTMVHGAMPPDAGAFVPVLADWIVCWGLFQKESLLAAGEKAEKILPLGNPAMSRILSAQAAIDDKAGDNRTHPTVMLASSPVKKDRRDKLVEIFCRAATNATSWQGFVRLHPSEHIENDAHFRKKYPKVPFHAPSSCTLKSDLALAALVVVENSSVGPEALMTGRLVVVFSTEDGPPSGLSGELIVRGGAPLAKNEFELDAAIRGLLFNAQKRAEALGSAEKYAVNFCALYGEDSAQTVTEFISGLTKRNDINLHVSGA